MTTNEIEKWEAAKKEWDEIESVQQKKPRALQPVKKRQSLGVDERTSRASSFCEDHEGHVAARSFQSIWTRLSAEELTQEKTQAMDVIDRAQLSSARASASKIPYCICGTSRPNVCPLRSTTLADEQLLIVALSKVSYSETNPLHWELLCSTFKFLTDERTGRAPLARSGPHWERVGFQGDDPATDLRGVGIFGLCQLLFLVSNGLTSQMTAQLLQLSNDKVQSFPLAVVGLNWTAMILERVKQGKLNWLAVKENSFITVVNGIYRGCFLSFWKLWKTRNCTIVDFANVSNEIRDTIKRRPKSLLNMAVLTHS
uniref:ELMO domain-containing protein n=1 Tax=Steinernema glaseri TaxID=37863 RepID=A0A1I8A1D5_9BILA